MTEARGSGVLVDTMVINWLLPLVSHDRVFIDAPGLLVITAPETP